MSVTDAPDHSTPTTASSEAGRRVLVLSTDLGGGHDALAAGLREELGQRDEPVHVEVENGLHVVNPFLNELARDGYKSSVERQPWSYQLWYWLLSATALARVVRWIAWRGMRRRILARIEQSRPDVVVSTYPFLTAVLGKLRREGDLAVPAVGLLIDSGPHDLWLAPGIDLHVAMNPADCDRAREAWPPQSYYPTLEVTSARPAVDPRCRRDTFDRAAGRLQFDLPADARVLLVSGGSWGLALPDEVLLRILDQTDLHIAVAVGRNESLADHLLELLPAERSTVVRFTREMPTLLHASDAALLNAGGMTCHECFALGTPVILFDPLPGHGRSAARALHEDGLALHAKTADDLLATLDELSVGAAGDLRRRADRALGLANQPLLGDVVLDARLREIPAGDSIVTTAGRAIKQRLGLVIAALVAVGLGTALWSQRAALADFEWHLSWPALVGAIALVALGPLTQAIAFWVLLRQFGVAAAGLGESMAVWSWSALARFAPGGVMMLVVRVREGERLSASRMQVLGTSAYEQALAIVGAALVSVAGFLVAATEPPPVVIIVAAVGVIAVVAARPRLLGGRLLHIAQRFGAQLEQLPRGRAMSLVLALNCAGWVAVGSGALVALTGLVTGDAPSLGWMVGVYALAWMIGFVTPLAPGGLGVREAVLTSFLAPVYGLGAAAVIAIGLRIVHMAADLLASGVIELGYRLRRSTALEFRWSRRA
ncbi:MAG: hypothetical protein JWL76_1203 [Thermoleophilia bacterium]|nr:hypothetical protein [Thermoleophilia bacterium]